VAIIDHTFSPFLCLFVKKGSKYKTVSGNNCTSQAAPNEPTLWPCTNKMWACATCSYHNINARASKCHICRVTRADFPATTSATSNAPIVDLTGLCSPKPSVAVGGFSTNGTTDGRGGDRVANDMESNRSRRRRLSSQSANSEVYAIKPTREDAAVGKREDTSTYETSGNDKDQIGKAFSNEVESTKNPLPKQQPPKKNRVVLEIDMSDDEMMVDPLPRKKLPLNKTSNATLESEKRASSSSARNKRGFNGTAKASNEGKREDTNITSFKSGDTTKNNGSRLTDFYNQQQRPETVEQLMERANAILQKTFNHNSLRPLQEEAVKGALQKKSQIIIMATGGGKSLCYQIPALLGNGPAGKVRAEDSCVTIVVCPLIALMVDQVNNLHKKGIHTAACWSSSHSAKVKADVMNRLQIDKKEGKQGKSKRNIQDMRLTPIQILYCTPELLETDKFRAILTKLHSARRLHLIAIDEAHCLSTWGHDFRPAYRKLRLLREAFPSVPIMACEYCKVLSYQLDTKIQRFLLPFNHIFPLLVAKALELPLPKWYRILETCSALIALLHLV
jgi:hypothetical protein